MKKPTVFFIYIQTSTPFLLFRKFSRLENLKKRNAISFNMLIKSCLFQQL